MCKSVAAAVLGAVGLMLGAEAASAASPATGTLPVQVTIVADCKVQSAPVLNFGDAQGLLDSAVNGSTTLGIQCTNSTGYNVRLDAGSGAGATVANRLMTGGGATVSYTLYRDAARTQVWGVTDGTNTVAGTGNGAVQTINVYGQIPAQTTPAPGAYTDTVQVTVSY
jgi:spore coat protein U-like protein